MGFTLTLQETRSIHVSLTFQKLNSFLKYTQTVGGMISSASSSDFYGLQKLQPHLHTVPLGLRRNGRKKEKRKKDYLSLPLIQVGYVWKYAYIKIVNLIL